MLEPVSITLAFGLPSLATAYWICLIVGGGLLLISSVAGGDSDAGLDADVDAGLSVDADADMDVDLNADVDAGHAHASSLATWFSMQFAVFFLAVFGVIGVVMTYMTVQTEAVIFACALVGGLAVGQGVHQTLRKLRRSSGDSTPQARDYINKHARVTITVTATQKGEVALYVGLAERFVPAVSKHPDQTFNPGDRVAVVDYRGGIAEVVSREEYEFLTDDDGHRERNDDTDKYEGERQ